MFDLRWLRDNPSAFDASLARRGQPPAAESILALDARRREIETRLQEEQAERNALSRRIGELKARREDASEPMRRVAALKDGLKAGEDALREAQAALDAALASYPNIVAADVPDGRDETANIELRRWSSPRQFNFSPKPHDELGVSLGMDFVRAAKLSGARFVALWDKMARLERALAQLMLDIQTREHGYTEVAVPYLVRSETVYGTGQLPKFAEDLFQTTSGHWLIPTAEVPLTNLLAGEIVEEQRLPLRLTAYSPCFRSEAGAAGRDTRGMIRNHQFTKVELVSLTTPEQSAAEHERMTACAEAVLQRLDLPYRVITLCAGDLGFGATKTFDLEVWLPGQGAYREISSCSNCGDFQARRMNTRYRPAEGKGTRFIHTLNGSGLAVGRTLVAVLENYQEVDGSVRIPEALRPWMGGLELLEPVNG
ncbi:MAG TPA: serine--tRNA ligase [Geminicoccaceae bacterium]|nr:serine--tRNA ligase [Geminicoccus sp.]HMU53312.1 serine--tRNA ligase [Geminicoccaceae bacterium]